jgi:predicted nucleic acid-binding protein
MYSIGKQHPLKEVCKVLLQKITVNEIDATIDVELLQELLYVYSSRGERKKGLDVVENILILFPNPLIVRKPEIEKAKDFMRKYYNLSPRDAVHCAVIVNYGLEGIISVDKDFDSVREIQRFMP